jgi:hypothetical protein
MGRLSYYLISYLAPKREVPLNGVLGRSVVGLDDRREPCCGNEVVSVNWWKLARPHISEFCS